MKRLVDRNGLSAEEALRRIESQMTNEQRVARANVVLCTLWHADVTQKQVRPRGAIDYESLFIPGFHPMGRGQYCCIDSLLSIIGVVCCQCVYCNLIAIQGKIITQSYIFCRGPW